MVLPQLRRDLYKYTDKHMHGVVKSGEVDISFDVDVKGNLSDFKINSETGVENLLVEALKELGPWLPATKSYKPVAQRITYSFYYQTMWDREHNKQPASKKAWKHREPVHYEPRDPWRPKIKSNAYGMQRKLKTKTPR